MSLAGRGAQTFTSAGATLTCNTTIAAFGGSYTVQDSFHGTGLTLTSGTFNDGGHAVTTTSFSSTGTTTCALTMTGAWTLTSTGTVWNVAATGLTFSPSGATIAITDISSTRKTFAGGGLSYPPLTITTGGRAR